MTETEITNPVDLCLPDGRLNPAAVGWTRQALHRANLKGWGRNKRFEYWSIATPEVIIAVNISHHDYRANVSLSCVDRTAWTEIRQGGNRWLPAPGGMADPWAKQSMAASAQGASVILRPNQEGTRLVGSSDRIEVDLQVLEEAGHESMGVVVPWSQRKFQYTKKDNCLRAVGTVIVDGVKHQVEPSTSYAIHDRGRGRWPYRTFWNWGSGSGRTGGHDIGLQFGGRWTEGTPSTENWVRVDGRVHKISDQLRWDYDPKNWLQPWQITGPTVDIVFRPVTHSYRSFNRGIVLSRTDSCFGQFEGEITLESGEIVVAQDIFGHVEDVHRRW